MNVGQIMNKEVKFINKDKTIQEAAKIMRDSGIGCMPVEENDKLIGMITDRDIVMTLAEGKGPQTHVKECIKQSIKYCFEDEDLEDVASQMSDLQIRRMPVMSRDKQLVGIVSLGDISLRDQMHAGETLQQISR